MNLPENQNSVTVEPLNLLNSLLNSINHTQSFKSKWNIIITKLNNLNTLISDLTSFPETSFSGDLIKSVSNTLCDALPLSITCHTGNLPAGKLKTQNDIDSITSKLDNHIRDLDIVIKSGVLHDDVVSSVSKVSKKELVRVTARNLITRLQIGSVNDNDVSRSFDLDSLIKLINEDDKNVVIVVAQGVVPVIVRLLDSGSSFEILEKSVIVIARVSSVDSCKHVLMAEGLLLLHYLIRVLKSGTGFAKEKACITLQSLTFSKENAIVIGSRGGISSLLEICRSGTPTSQASAAAVCRNLTTFSDTRNDFIEEHAISVLLTLASSGTIQAQEHSIACLSNLVRDDDDMKLLIAKKGGIDSLKSFWDSAFSEQPVIRSLEVAVEFLSNLASDQRLIEFIILNDFLNRLVNVLNCGVLGVRIHAAEAIYKIGYNAKTRKELGEFGFIPPLIRMLDGKANEEIDAAAKTLSTILIYTENRRIYWKDERGIASVVRLLDPMITNIDRKYPVSILMALIHSRKCRKQMVNSGALLHIQKLVTMEVEGAKKLQESIGGGKIWGVFKRPENTTTNNTQSRHRRDMER